MVGQYTKECSIVFIMILTSAPFQLSQPFPYPTLNCLCCSEWSSVTSQKSQCALIKCRGWKGVISNTDKVKKCANFAIAHKTVGYKSKTSFFW